MPTSTVSIAISTNKYEIDNIHVSSWMIFSETHGDEGRSKFEKALWRRLRPEILWAQEEAIFFVLS